MVYGFHLHKYIHYHCIVLSILTYDSSSKSKTQNCYRFSFYLVLALWALKIEVFD